MRFLLKTWIPGETPEKEELKQQLDVAKKKLYDLQMKIKEHKIPVLVLFEGWSAAGKGSMIGKVIKNIDPRFFKVATMSVPSEEELRRPFLYRYMCQIPEQGKFTFLDAGWMEQTTQEVLNKKLEGEDYEKRIESIRRFERQLTDNGYLVLKFFMHIDKEEQKERMDRLCASKDTRWRVSDFDKWQQEHYHKCEKVYDRYLKDTNASTSPWYIIDAKDKKWAELQVMDTLVSSIEVALQNQSHSVPILQNVFPPLPAADAEANKEVLENAPHQLKEDLAITYHVVVGKDQDGLSSMFIKNDLLEQYGISAEQLHEDAMKSSPRVMAPEVSSIGALIDEMYQKNILMLTPDEREMLQETLQESSEMPTFFVVTNTDRIDGAGVIFYPEFMDSMGELLGNDFFILPSSIHEMLVLPDDGQVDAEMLRDMVKEVNATQVAPAERLTNDIYHFDTKDHVFEKADRFTERQKEKEAQAAKTEKAGKEQPDQKPKTKKHDMEL